MKRIADLRGRDRFAAADEHIGRVRRITYRSIKSMPFDRTITGTVIGASYPLTNGTGTGDLIVQAPPGHTWSTGTKLLTISLSNVATIEPVDEAEERTSIEWRPTPVAP